MVLLFLATKKRKARQQSSQASHAKGQSRESNTQPRYGPTSDRYQLGWREQIKTLGVSWNPQTP